MEGVREDLAAAEPRLVETPGVFGLHQTDINQYVYTGAYAALLAEQATALLAAEGGDVARHAAERVALVFRRPFAAGDRYVARARQHRADGRTLTVVGLHPVHEGEAKQRPALLGRMLGREIGARPTSVADKER
jgi:hypothetical protein